MRILLLGGNRSNVPSLQALRQAGVETVVADRDPQAAGLSVAAIPLPIDLIDVEALRGAVARLGGVEGVVSMSEVGVRAAARLSEVLGLPHISVAAATRASSKRAMREAWQGLPFSVPFHIASTLEEARAAAGALGYPLIFKPDRSLGGSRGVSTVLDGRDVDAAWDFARTEGLPQTSVVIERRVVGTEFSAEVLIWQNRTEVLCVGQKVKSPPPYRVDLAVRYPAALSPQQHRVVVATCQQAVFHIGLEQGLAHVEFGLHPDGITVFELGARTGGGHTPLLTPQVCGVDELFEACRMACGQAPSQPTARWQRGGEYRFLTFPPGRVRHTEVADELLRQPWLLDAAILATPGSDIVPVQTASHRSGYIVTAGADAAEAAARADGGLALATVEYEDGRRASALPLP